MSAKPIGSGWKSRPRPDRDPPLDLSGMVDEAGTIYPTVDCERCDGDGFDHGAPCYCLCLASPPGLVEWWHTVKLMVDDARTIKGKAAVLTRAGVYLETMRAKTWQDKREAVMGVVAFIVWVWDVNKAIARERAEREARRYRIEVEAPREYEEGKVRLKYLIHLKPDARPIGEPGATQARLAMLEQEMGMDTTAIEPETGEVPS